MDTPDVQIDASPSRGYALSGKIMLSAIIVLFAVVVFMVCLHLYARWYLVRLRRRQLEQRRQRRGNRTHVILSADTRNPAETGLALSVINSLPYFLYSSKSEQQQPPLECAVCISEFEAGDIVRLLPKCNHNFHLDCIDMWFRSHSTCPLCRSGVEEVIEQYGPVRPPTEVSNEPEACSSSGSGLFTSCRHVEEATSLGERRKGLEVRIDVPQRRVELDGEMTQSSPSSRMLALKRILSMGRKSPIGGGATSSSPRGVGTSRGSVELDLESGVVEITREPSRFQTPV